MNEINIGIGDVQFLLSLRLRNTFKTKEKIYNNILKPIPVDNDELYIKHKCTYGSLKEDLKKIKKEDLLLLIENSNAKISREKNYND